MPQTGGVKELKFVLSQLCVLNISVVSNSVNVCTIAHQAPLSMALSRQEYWSGLLCPSPGDLPDPRIEPACLASPALPGGFLTTGPPGKITAVDAKFWNQDVSSGDSFWQLWDRVVILPLRAPGGTRNPWCSLGS